MQHLQAGMFRLNGAAVWSAVKSNSSKPTCADGLAALPQQGLNRCSPALLCLSGMAHTDHAIANPVDMTRQCRRVVRGGG